MLNIILLAIVVEAITEIIVDSKLFEGMHAWLYNQAHPSVPVDSCYYRIISFVCELTSCGYCTSVWIAAILSLFVNNQFDLGHMIVNWVVSTFVLHRLSNLLHVIYGLIRNGRIAALDVNLNSNVKLETINAGIRSSSDKGDESAEA